MRAILMTTAAFAWALTVALIRGPEWARAHRAEILRPFLPRR